MKKSMVVFAASLFTFLSATFFPTLQTTYSAAATSRDGCVGCHVSGGCWICTGTGEGVSCPSVSCGSCTTSDVCSGAEERKHLCPDPRRLMLKQFER